MNFIKKYFQKKKQKKCEHEYKWTFSEYKCVKCRDVLCKM